MTSKRKREGDNNVNEQERRTKRLRRRKRSHSEPLMNETDSAEKRQALKRLFGRIGSQEAESDQRRLGNERDDDDFFSVLDYADENEDPLLDMVPVNMDPEQLGFLVCAQETLRFLQCRGLPLEHPVFTRLRSRLLQGIGEMAMA